MIKELYIKKIIAGEITIDDVPALWKDEVQEELDKINKK